MKNLNHIAIILDGNRRFAKAKNLPSFEGHRQGFENLKKISRVIFDKGISVLTVYAFSTENWKREKKEVAYLMDLFRSFVKKEVKKLIAEGVKVNFFGRIEDFDEDLREAIKNIAKETQDGRRGVLNVCLSYGGRDEIVRSVQKIVKQGIKADDIDQDLISQNLDSAGLPDPDLIIRTSGEKRLSGFLTWQSVYSELYFPDKTWPDFSPEDVDRAILEYNNRQRRFGGN